MTRTIDWDEAIKLTLPQFPILTVVLCDCCGRALTNMNVNDKWILLHDSIPDLKCPRNGKRFTMPTIEASEIND